LDPEICHPRVLAGLDPAIQQETAGATRSTLPRRLDDRVKPGHDGALIWRVGYGAGVSA
jgi:hypothetical protein